MEALEYMHGKHYVLDGISGKFKLSTSIDRYGAPVYNFSHVPDAAGKRSEKYKEIRRRLHDDWSTLLSDTFTSSLREAEIVDEFVEFEGQ